MGEGLCALGVVVLLYNCEALLWDPADHPQKLELMLGAAVLASCRWEYLILAFSALRLHIVEAQREAEVCCFWSFSGLGLGLRMSRGKGCRGYWEAERSLMSCWDRDISHHSLHFLCFSTACNTYYLVFFVSGWVGCRQCGCEQLLSVFLQCFII